MRMSRRRFIAVTALATGAAVVGFRQRTLRWQGVALGADASIAVSGGDERAAQAALDAGIDTIRRMERLFSLHDPESTLSQLNAKGAIVAPPEFERLMALAGDANRLTGGLFDPTIQPLFAARMAGRIPGEAEFSRVGWKHVQLESGRVAFARPGMAMTLNGIAQGFATDRVSETLAAHGFAATLVNVGEWRAGDRPSRIGVAGADGHLAGDITLENAAVATSARAGTLIAGNLSHIMHPAGLDDMGSWQSATVVAPTAAMADALSTALILSKGEDLARSLRQGPVSTILLEGGNGNLLRI